MESGQRSGDALGKGASTVNERGRVYKSKGYPVLHVFSIQLVDVIHLRDLWGGNYYKHGSGYLWILGKREGQLQVLKDVKLSVGSLSDRLTVLDEMLTSEEQTQ